MWNEQQTPPTEDKPKAIRTTVRLLGITSLPEEKGVQLERVIKRVAENSVMTKQFLRHIDINES